MYDQFIALDWAQSNMAIAKLTKYSEKPDVIDVSSNVDDLKDYLSLIKGKKILTFEETTTSQWLYTELKEYVDEILVCDPTRNYLLSEGAKNDKIDAKKLCFLLRGNLLKPVYHSCDKFIDFRKLINSYDRIVRNGTRLMNRRSAVMRSLGKSKKEKESGSEVEDFIIQGIDESIEQYEKEKKRYETEFKRLSKEYKEIRLMESIPGIGIIGAIRILAIVVSPYRFKDKSSWLSFCGLIRLERMSGGKSYGQKSPRYNRAIKNVFKTAALTTTRENSDNPFKDYYLDLINKKGYAPYNARHSTARRIAVIALGILKSNKSFKNKWRVLNDID